MEAHYRKKQTRTRNRQHSGHTRIHHRRLNTPAAIALLLLIVVLIAVPCIRSCDVQKNRSYSVYCLGDSITYGTGVADTRDTDSYPALLGDLLGNQYTVYNYGVSGKTLLDNTEKPYKDTGYLEAVQAADPDIIVVMLGSNDSKPRNWQPAEFKTQYLHLVEMLQQIESRPDIYIASPPEAFAQEDGTTAYEIDNDVIANEIREIVREVAKETSVKMIDIYAATENHPEYFPDGVHPNKAGNAVLADMVYDEIHKFWMP